MVDTTSASSKRGTSSEHAVPSDLAPTRVPTTLAAGGQLLDGSEEGWRIADPEGNGMVIVAGA